MPLTAAVVDARGALHGRRAAALRLHRQGARSTRRPATRPAWALLVTAAALAANALMVACAAHGGDPPVLLRAARGARRTTRPTPTGASPLGPAILAALGLLCGLAPALIGDAPRRAHGRWRSPAAPWTGTSPSGTAWARPSSSASSPSPSAAALYLGLDRIRDGARRGRAVAAAHRGLVRRGPRAASPPRRARLTGAVQNGRMTSYLRNTFLALALLTWGALLAGAGPLAAARALGRAHRLGDHGDHPRLDRRGAAHPLAAHRDHRARRRRRRASPSSSSSTAPSTWR